MVVTSALIDATVCLLLVSAGVGTLVSVNDPSAVGGPASGERAADRADATAETLATATASVNYSLATGVREAGGPTDRLPRLDGNRFRRTDHGSLARLLADAAVANTTVDGRRTSLASVGFVRAVRTTVANRTGPRVQVVALWRPSPGGAVEGRVVAGAEPPRTGAVHAAALAVPVGGTGNSGASRRTGEASFGRLAEGVARKTIRTLVPAGRTETALRADYPASALVEHRYRRLGAALGVEVLPAVERGNTTAANRQLTRVLQPRVERGLRDRFPSAERAGESTAASRVRIVVRTWSP
ncbi:hypothetical protein ACFO0N_12435 [Halobium salinum]|uniref:Uncharacterized protein n=1 Tax=Halobium salinum TaxID=1364940 RepID=A0ABD5PDL0_9EURY|nr:hypothetical protein [Halobium salinum]